MDPNQSKDVNYQPAFNNPDYWNNTGNQNQQTTNPVPVPANPTPEPQLPQAEPTPPSTSILEPTQSSPSSTPPVNNPPSEPKPSGSSNGLMIIMVVLVIVLLAATGLFAFQNYQLKQQPSKTATTPTPLATASATPNPYATWKTYTNTKYQYSFKYPQDFVFTNTASPSSTASNVNLEPSSYSNKTSLELQSLPQIEAAILAFIPKTTAISDASTLFKAPGFSDIQGMNTVTINGYQTIQFSSTNTQAGSGKPSMNTLFKTQSGSFLLISLSNYQADPTMLQTYNNLVASYIYLTPSSSTSPYASPSASPSASPISNACGTGLKQFANSSVSFCYPDTLKETTASKDSLIVLSDATQTLKVTQNFQGGWGGSPCLFIDKTTVSGYASKRLSWKKENADGTCQSVFTSFAEMVNEGNFTFPFPYAIELTNQKGTYPDNSMFLSIEKSFKVLATGAGQ